ncbi:unnamed protein product [Arabis nemorensis]|uniref:RST domain-containing protein n=1 Tax=Arabis nemorensis TaxID=586526 RepID=A0A565BKW0_9BRAS|nr:unnamed protein product [Arabis nemorensis]
MDPSIFKLLEEDEDESMHSGADVDAFQAALNRDIEGSMTISPPLGTNPGNNESPSQQFATWKNGLGDANINLQTQHSLESTQMKEQQGSALDSQHQHDLKRTNESHLQHSQPQDLHRAGQLWENPSQASQTTGLQMSEKTPSGNELERSHNQENESQYAKLQKMSSQQARGVEQPVNPMNRNLKQVPFAALLPALVSQLDPDRAMQLRNLYARLKKNEIPKEGFTRHMKDIVGDQMLRLAVSKLQQINYNQVKMGIQAPSTEISNQKSQSDPRAVHLNQLPSSTSGTLGSSVHVQGLTKHPQHQMQLPSTSFPMYTGSGNFHSYPGPTTNASGSSLRPLAHDSHMRHVAHNQTMGSTGLGGPPQSTTNMMTMPKFERPTSVNDPNRVQGGTTSHFQNSSSLHLNSVPGQGSSVSHVKQESVEQSVEHNNAAIGTSNEGLEKESSRMVLSTPSNVAHASSVSPSMTNQLDTSTEMNSRGSSGTFQAGVNGRTPPKKPSVGQKKPLDTLGSSPPPASKKQKVAGNSSDQSIEQLNDVTAVSGVNLREEEEQLFSGGKEDGRVSEASRRIVHEEEERLILQKSPLQKKLAEIMAKVGLKHISNDVERCLSLCVEERMRGLLSHIIRLSKQRVDTEKSRHRTFITSDIRLQINEMNQKVKEEWEKKQAEAEKLKKPSESEEGDGVDSEKEKEDNRSKGVKGNKEDDDKMRTTAANVAARAAVGGDDAFLKWQLMAEARQKSVSEAGKDGNQKATSGGGRNSKDRQDGGRRFSGTGGRRLGKNQGSSNQPKEVRTISAKDVIAVLEREPQMSKSTLMYRLIQ